MNMKKVEDFVWDKIHYDFTDDSCTIVKRVDTFFKEKYLRTVA